MISPIKDTFLKRNGNKVTPRRKTDWFLLNQAKPYSIGDPYSPGFGLGVVSPDMVPPGIIPYYGTYNVLHPEYGHYYHTATGSDLCCIVPFWIKLNPTKDPPVLVKDFDQYSTTAEAAVDGYYMPRGFYDGGDIKPFFIDTYVNSKTALISTRALYGSRSICYSQWWRPYLYNCYLRHHRFHLCTYRGRRTTNQVWNVTNKIVSSRNHINGSYNAGYC
jgi:hypothetical protein